MEEHKYSMEAMIYEPLLWSIRAELTRRWDRDAIPSMRWLLSFTRRDEKMTTRMKGDIRQE